MLTSFLPDILSMQIIASSFAAKGGVCIRGHAHVLYSISDQLCKWWWLRVTC